MIVTDNKNLDYFITDLANLYTPYFDVYRDEKINDLSLAFIAQFKRRDERYMVSKKIKVYSVENQQVIFTAVCKGGIQEGYLKKFQQEITNHLEGFIPNDREHMSTVALGIIVTDEDVSQEDVREVRRYRKLKFLKFGFHGWIEMYLAIINPYHQQIEIHPKGKSLISPMKKLLKEEVHL